MIQGHFDVRLLESLDRRHQAFTFLREPVERAISFFYYLKKNPTDDFPIDPGQKIETIFDSESADYFDNLQVRYLCGKPAGKLTQTDLDKAIRNLEEKFAFVGTVETIVRDMDVLRSMFGLDESSLKILNVNRTRPRTSDLSPEVINKFQQHNLLDLDIYEHVKTTRVAGMP